MLLLRSTVLALTATYVASAGFPDCVNGPLAANLVCDPAASISARAEALVAEFTVPELIANLGNRNPGFPRLGLPSYDWANEALHGLATASGTKFQPAGQNFSSASSFPVPLNLGATQVEFHDSLVREVASVTSTEARAFNNFGFAGLDFWTPNINPFKDPRWGRGSEVAGEDPLHVSRYARNFILGLQGDVGDNYLKVAADCKHWAAYDLERWNGVVREGFDAVVSTQDMVEYYSPPFQTCVRDAKAASVMCSYNAVNGVPACASPYLMQDILRDHWGLNRVDNWIVSDCDSVHNIFDPHHFVESDMLAAVAALKAGVTLNCGPTYQRNLEIAFNASLVNDGQLRHAVRTLYASFIRLGYFDPPDAQAYRKFTWADVNVQSAQDLAHKAAVESMVLLKNDGILPIRDPTSKIAMIGPLSNATVQMQGNYHGIAPFLISPLQGMREAGFDVTFVQGTNVTGASDDVQIAPALDAAAEADIVVYVGGLDLSVEAESMDRSAISWPENQLELIKRIADVGRPLIVVQMGGGPVDGSWLESSTKVNALVWAGYPGQSGGSALADVIRGASSPAGRLPVTQYPTSYVDQIPMTDMSLRPSAKNASPGRTYKWYTGKPVYEFGFGLHYTSFDVQWVGGRHRRRYDIQELVAAGRKSPHLDLALIDTFQVAVKNTGNSTSDYVVLLFANTDVGPSPAPLKELVSYDRILSLQAGRRKTAFLEVTLGSLSRVDVNGDRHLYPGTYNLWIDTTKRIVRQIELVGKRTQVGTWPRPPER